MYDGSIKIGTNIDNKGIDAGIGKIKNSLKGLAGAIGVAFGTATIINFGKESVKTASELSNALTGLQSIVEGQGRSFSKAKAFIEDYISDGLVPLTNAVTAYKNLAARGYDDTQTQQVMTALKDSAAFGRQASYSLGDAVTTATEGLKNENSILVDNAGVTKNVAKMWDEYAKSIGTTAQSLTQQQKIQAEVNGILAETRFQTGDAAKVAESYSGQVSQLSFNVNNLKVALGNALIPIAQAVLPGINAIITGLTGIVNMAGQVVTTLFGTQSKKQKEVGSTASKAAKQENELAKATKAAAKEAKGAISGFDELNVVRSEKIGGMDEVTKVPTADAGVENTLNGIDKITPKAKEIAEKIKQGINIVKKALSDFSPLLKGIATGFAAAFALKWVAGAIAKARKLPIISSIIGGITLAAKSMSGTFKATGRVLPSLSAGLKSVRDSLSKTQKAMIGLAGAVVVFTTVKNAVKELVIGNMDLGTAMLNIIPICAAVGVALYAALGPVGLVVAAVAAAAGAFIGMREAEEELQKQKVEEYFSGVALKAEDLNTILSPMTDQFTALTEVINDHQSATEGLRDEYDTASQSLDMVYTQLENGTGSVPNSVEVIHEGLLSLADTLKKTADEDTQYYYSSWKQTFANTGNLSDSESARILSNIIQLGEDKKKEIDRIESEITAIHDTAKGRNVGKTVEYTQTELAKLKGFQSDLDALMAIERNKEVAKSQYEAAQLYEDIKAGRIKVNNETYDELLGTIKEKEEESVEIAKTNQTQQLVDAEAYWESAKIIYKDNAAELAEAEETYNTMRQQAAENYNQALNEASNVANSTRLLLKEGISEDQKAMSEAKDTLDKYNEAVQTLDGLTRGAIYAQNLDKESRERLNKTIEDQKKKVSELNNKLENSKSITKDWTGVWKEEAPKVREEVTKMVNAIDGSISESVQNFETYGINSAQGLINGYEAKYKAIKDAATKMYTESQNALHAAGGFGSPSKKMRQYGVWAGQGFSEGVDSQKPFILSSFSTLFNVILDKTDLFCARFRDAIHDLMDGMTGTMNTAWVGSSGKITYNKMPPIQIPRLATGAVIPPRAEYLAILGDQRNGVNIETPERLMRQIVREESGGMTYELLSQIVGLVDDIRRKDTAVTLTVGDRELARAVRQGERKLGYPIRG